MFNYNTNCLTRFLAKIGVELRNRLKTLLMHTIYYVGQHKLSMVLVARSAVGIRTDIKNNSKMQFYGSLGSKINIYNLRSLMYHDSM